MASMPQQHQHHQRHSSPDQASHERTPSPTPQSPVLTRSVNSEDSQVVILDHRAASQEEPSTLSHPDSQPKQGFQTPDEPDSTINKCWICFADANEDTPDTSPWRDPCPCALVAHEECLLDWIADMEAPKNSRNRSLGAPQITCPQCKSEIKLARPRNYIVDLTRGLERLGTRLIWPSAGFLLTNLVIKGSFALGEHTVYRIFGMHDGFRILRPLLRQRVMPQIDFDLPARAVAARVLYEFTERARHWRLYVGVPLISPLLILSRTGLADSVLPVLPVFFLATQVHMAEETLDFTAWPPSASMAFAVLPYIRSAYNFYYERVWAKKEQEWIKEIQPRGGQDGDAAEQQGGAAANAADEGDNMFEVRIEEGIWDGWEGNGQQGNAPQQQQDEQPAAPNAQRANPQPNNVPAQQQQAAAAAEPLPEPAAHNHDRRLSFSTTAVAETLLGALAFPTLAELSGELLRFTLPKAWTTAASPRASSIAAKGLLQEKWGRSLVGGCLFVVVKDALMLYVRWRAAKMHRERRVLDFDRKGKGKVAGRV
ncbi:hypothetical protein Q7P37_004860 [Cladosporium fusiforme]